MNALIKDVHQYLKISNDAMEEGRYEDALNILKDALKYYKTSPKIWKELVEVNEKLAISETDTTKKIFYAAAAAEAMSRSLDLIDKKEE